MHRDKSILSYNNLNIALSFYIAMKADRKNIVTEVGIIKNKGSWHSRNQANSIVFLMGFALLVCSVQGCVVINSKATSEKCTICSGPTNFTCVYQSSKGSTEQLNSGACTSVCCNAEIFQNTSKYDKCLIQDNSSMDNNSQGSLSLATILIIVFFSIPAGICIFIAIVTCVSNHRRRRETADNNPPPLSAIDLRQHNMEELGPFYQDRTQACSICLQTQCNLRTKCGHIYHTACLNAWIHKKEKCPLCVSRDFNPILLYCTLCFKQAKMTILIDQMEVHQKEEWQRYVWVKCQGCQRDDKHDEVSIHIEEVVSFNRAENNEKEVKRQVEGIKEIQPLDSVSHINRDIS